MPGLRIIDGSPTAISKFIREEEAKAKRICSECGSEMHTVAESGYGHWIRCPKCGHEEKVTEGKK